MHWTTLANLGRAKDIALTLLKYGFDDVVDRLELPGLAAPHPAGADAAAQTVWVRIRRALEDLGPTFVKFGQVMSVRPDLLPAPLILELAKLQDQVPAEELDEVKPSLERSLGQPLDEVFLHIDETPLAAASLSQVHRAVLRDSGAVVALKIRRPGVEAMVRSDLELLAAIAHQLHERVEQLRFYDLPRLVEVTKRTLLNELDFRREARNLRIAGANMAELEGVRIPAVHGELVSERVLAMELMEGRRLTELEGCGPEEGLRLARLGLRAVTKQILSDGFFHADPHPGNILVLTDGSVCLLDWGMTGRLTERDRYGLVNFIRAAVDRDAEKFTDAVLEFVDHGGRVDRRGLETDLADILDSFYALELQQINLGGLMSEVTDTLRLHDLHTPPAFAVMIKALITAEGTARRLHPGLNVVAEVEPLVRDTALRDFSPARLWRRFRRAWSTLAGFNAELPKRFINLSQKLERGELSIRFEHQNLGGLRHTMENVTNRLTFGIIIAAMLIGSSMIITTGLKPHVWGYPVLGVIGYVVSGLLGLWLIYTIIRTRRY